MKKCPHCGAVMKDGAVSFCEICKMELPKEQATVQPVQDEYYNDVLPDDANDQPEPKKSSNTAIKVGLLLFAVGLVIATCVVLMTMLG